MIPKNSLAGSRSRRASKSKWAARALVSTLLLAQVSWATPSFADGPAVSAVPIPSSTVLAPIVPTIFPIKPGDKVPWPGLLLNAPAVAQIKVDLDIAKEQCAITVKKEVDTTVANYQYQLDVQKATMTREKSVVEAQLRSSQALATDLQQRLDKAEKDRPNVYLWTGLGVAGGVVLTVLTVFAVSHATK